MLVWYCTIATEYTCAIIVPGLYYIIVLVVVEETARNVLVSLCRA